MNKAETWRRFAKQQTEQRIQDLTKGLDKLRQMEIESADEIAHGIASKIEPLILAITQLTDETRGILEEGQKTADHSAGKVKEGLVEIRQATQDLRELITELMENQAQNRRIQKWNIIMWIMTALLIAWLSLEI